MGWLDKLPWRKREQNTKYADMLNGYTPIFSQFGQDIYASDVVQQALMCIVSEMKKLNPKHIRVGSSMADAVPVPGNIQNILDHPNELMTKADFIEKIMWSLLFNYNAFVIPTYYRWVDQKTGAEKRVYTGLYPVQPLRVEFIQDPTGTLYIKMVFQNNYETTLRYSDVIHVRHKFSVNEFMGGNHNGQPDNKTLLKTLELNHSLLEGVGAAMKSSFAVNGVVQYNTLMDNGKTEAALRELEERLKKSESGFLGLDLKSTFTPIKKDIKLVDADTLKFIDEKILRNWGISLSILTGDFTKDQYEAFYQKVLEGFIISISQAFTKTLFTQRELSFGNEIRFYPKDLVFMSIDQTIEMVRLLGDAGDLYENEKRIAFGLPPLPELEGVRKQSLNYVDVNIANQYQIGTQKQSEQSAEEGEQ